MTGGALLASGPQAGADADNYADQVFAGLREQDATLDRLPMEVIRDEK
jgi:hypothetical protein